MIKTAVSTKEKYYVNVLKSHIQSVKHNATFCICQVYKLGVILQTGSWVCSICDDARNFNADVIVVLNDLGEFDEMKTLGLFEHYGVANH